MTSYNGILDTQVDPDAPITSTLGYQFRDNPIAIAEGSSGAPEVEVAWHELETVTLGADGTTVAFTTDISAYRAIRIRGGSLLTATGQSVIVELNISSSWRTAVTHTLTNNAVTFVVDVDNVDEAGNAAKKMSVMNLADYNVVSGDWDAASFTAAATTLFGFSHYSTAADLVRVRTSGNWDVSEGGTSFTLFGIKRTQP